MSEPYHRGAAVLFADPARGLFLLQQKDEGYRPAPYGLSLFGGAIEAGESAEQAARREVAEELGREVAAGMPSLSAVFSGRLEPGFELTVFECRLEPAAFDRLAQAPVLEGRASVVVDRATLRGLRLIWGLERGLAAYLATA